MKVAIIGGGVSGLSTLWALNEYSSHEPHLYESGPYIGGHTNTVTYTPTPAAAAAAAAARKHADDQASASSGGKLMPTRVDTGFIVFNTVTYPNFLRFVKLIGATILESDMSFSVSRWGGASAAASPPKTSPGGSSREAKRGWFEWAGSSPGALFCQGSNLLNPSHWRMVWDVIRFNNQSLETLRQCGEGSGEKDAGSIGDWLDARGYGDSFRRNYLIPMTASIWSTPPSIAFSAFPAITLLRFMHNHHLLQILNRPQWLTLKGGSQTYVEKVLAKVPKEQIHHSKQGAGKIVQVVKNSSGNTWTVKSADGSEADYDEVVFATHADAALKILDQALEKGDIRRSLLAQFHFSKNVAVLHGDERLMPLRRQAWSAWNFIAEEQSSASSATHSTTNGSAKGANTAHSSPQDADRVSLTYWMNLLQSLPESKHGHVLVTLNPPTGAAAPRQELVAAQYDYDHPVYTAQSVRAQKAIRSVQGKDGLHFAGAWLAYGFHEDGFSSGLRVAERLGAQLPFDVRSAEREVPQRDTALLVIESLERCRSLAAMPLWAILYPVVLLITTLLQLVPLGGIGSTAARVQYDWISTHRASNAGAETWGKAKQL